MTLGNGVIEQSAYSLAVDVDVLVVDDDEALRWTWDAILRDAGYSVATAEEQIKACGRFANFASAATRLRVPVTRVSRIRVISRGTLKRSCG